MQCPTKKKKRKSKKVLAVAQMENEPNRGRQTVKERKEKKATGVKCGDALKVPAHAHEMEGAER